MEGKNYLTIDARILEHLTIDARVLERRTINARILERFEELIHNSF